MKVVKKKTTNTKKSRYNHAEAFFLEHYKTKTNVEIARLYRKEDGSRVPDNYMNRVKGLLNKFGQIDAGVVNANTKEKQSGMILSEHHKRIINDGYDEIQSFGIKRYAEMLGKEYGKQWDGIRKEIGLMRRFGII